MKEGELTNAQRAGVLVHALPYIREYTGKTVVIKYGGNAMISEELKNAVMGDVVLLSLIGVKVVVVHGGGPEISETLASMGKESRFVNGLRVTDAQTAQVALMVLAGKINKQLVALLGMTGGRAVGLSGLDAGLLTASKVSEELGFVGDIVSVDTRIITDVLDKGYIPVISTVGSDADGNVYNINADTAAARIAGELGAECLVSMTDTVGLLRKKDDPTTLIPSVTVSEVPSLIRSGVICGGMIPKAECCVEAIRRGVRKVFIIDGRVKHSILIELLTDEGIGTMFA